MIPFTLIGIFVIIALLLTTLPLIWLLYRYTRPKIEPIKTLLTWEAGIVTLLLLGTIIPNIWPQGCAHPKPPLSSSTLPCASGSITLSGSSALQSLMTKLANSYEHQCPETTINIINSTNQTGKLTTDTSGDGLNSVEDGSIDIGTSDIFATPDKSDLVDHEIAASIFAVIVNKDVQITNLKTSQIRGIYTGKYKNWQELGGPDEPITVLSRATGSGTRFTFDTYILSGLQQVPQRSPIPDTGTMIEDVQKTQGAIGYADLYDVSTNQQSLLPVSIDGVPASPYTATNNTYKFWTVEHLYTRGPAQGLAQAFIDYMGTDTAREIIQNSSFIDIYSMTDNALSQRCPTNGA